VGSKEDMQRDQRNAFVAEYVAASIALGVKANRLARGWTQRDLAKRAGMKQASIARLEATTAETMPSIRTLERVASAFDVALIVRMERFKAFAVPSADQDTGLEPRGDGPVTKGDE